MEFESCQLFQERFHKHLEYFTDIQRRRRGDDQRFCPKTEDISLRLSKLSKTDPFLKIKNQPTQYCKAIILQLKKKKSKSSFHNFKLIAIITCLLSSKTDKRYRISKPKPTVQKKIQ